MLGDEGRQVNTVGLAVIVVISHSPELGGSSKDHAMTVLTSYDTLVDQTPTPLPWTYLTEEVTDSNQVSPTSDTAGQTGFSTASTPALHRVASFAY
jgi:hypothetical protein